MLKYCVLLFTVLVLSLQAEAATYHAATTGSDTGSGATRCTRITNISTPALTINVAIACAVAGDTVKIAAGIYAQRIDLNSTVGGSAGGGYVTIEGAKALGPTVTNKTGSTMLYNAALGNVFMVYGRHVSYLKVKNLEVTGAGGGIGIFGSSHYIEVTDNYIHNNRTDVAALAAIRATAKYGLTTNQTYGNEFGSADHIIIARNHITNWTTGFNQTLPTAGTETLSTTADLQNLLIEDNLIVGGQFIGIDMIGKSVDWWYDNNFPTLPIPPQSWVRKAVIRNNTILSMKAGFGASDLGIYCDGCSEVVVERNRIEDCPGYGIYMSTEETNFLISQIIVRHNISLQCGTAQFGMGPGIGVSNPAIHGLSEHLRFAHNTAVKYKAGGPVYRMNWIPGAKSLNNIFKVSASVKVPYTWWGVGATNTASINYNLYHGSPPTESWEKQGVAYYPFATYQSVTGQDQQSLVSDPLFTSLATRNVTLSASSPALNRGIPLTTAVGGATGTVITVGDSRWFSDGYDMVQGDTIQIGSNLAIIESINYGTNQITLDRTVTWTNGMSVSYPYLSTAPDLGACEGVGICTIITAPDPPPIDPPPPVQPDITSNLTMHLRFDAPSGIIAEDSTANNHDGTIDSAVIHTTGIIGPGALRFNGSSTSQVTVVGELGTPAAITLAAWIYPSVLDVGGSEVVSIGDNITIRLFDTKVRGHYYTGSTWLLTESVIPASTAEPSHIAYVMQSGSQQLYINGVMIANSAHANAISYAGLGSHTIIGRHGNAGLNQDFSGVIDDVRVYSRALSAVDIAALAVAEVTPPVEPLSVTGNSSIFFLRR